MALILDTRELAVHERMAAMEATLSTHEVPSVLTGGESPLMDAGHLVDYWDWGGETHLTRILGAGLTITRGAKQIRAGAPERVGLGLQLGARSLFEHRDLQQIVEPGELALTDGTSVSEASWPDSAGAAMLIIDYDQLGLPVEVVRESVPRLGSSPLYPLARSHLAMLCQIADETSLGVARAMIESASIDLVRALITTAVSDARGEVGGLRATLALHVAKYVERHLAERTLTPSRIARAHNISLRTLYNAWSSAHDTSLAEWIISARLDGARADLAGDGRTSTVTALSQRWGFADPDHFTRRFRAAYGVTPRQWRQMNLDAP